MAPGSILIAATCLVMCALVSAKCGPHPTLVTVMTVNECVLSKFSHPRSAQFSGTQSIEGVMLSGIVKRSWNFREAGSKSQYLHQSRMLPPGASKGSTAVFFLDTKSCDGLVGETFNLVKNFRCCDDIIIPNGPSGTCILPPNVSDASIVSDAKLVEFQPPVEKAK
jgi:hypothetical protein